MPFAVVCVGASLQNVEAVGDGGECVFVVTFVVIVLIDAGEASEKEASIRIFTCRHGVVQRVKTDVRLGIILQRGGKGVDRRGRGHERDNGQGK